MWESNLRGIGLSGNSKSTFTPATAVTEYPIDDIDQAEKDDTEIVGRWKRHFNDKYPPDTGSLMVKVVILTCTKGQDEKTGFTHSADEFAKILKIDEERFKELRRSAYRATDRLLTQRARRIA